MVYLRAGSPVCALLGVLLSGHNRSVGKPCSMQLLSLRWTVSALIFIILSALRIVRINYKGKDIRLILMVGILQPCIYSIFETMGIKLTTTSESSIFIATIPLMVLLIGSLFLHRKNSKKTIAAIAMAFAGVVICVAGSPGFSIGGKGTGYLLLLGAVITGALYSYAGSKAAEQFDAIEVTFGISIMGCIFFNWHQLRHGLRGQRISGLFCRCGAACRRFVPRYVLFLSVLSDLQFCFGKIAYSDWD